MSRRVVLSTAFAILASLWSATAGAQEQEPTPPGVPDHDAAADAPKVEGAVALLGLQIAGDAPPELKALIETSIRKGIEDAGLQMIALARVAEALANEPDLVDCVSTTCLQRIGELTGAAHFLRASVDAVGAAYTLKLVLMSTKAENNEERRLEESCPVCTLTEVSELLIETSNHLVTADELPVPVVIATRPQGADLLIDEQPVGTAPFHGSLAPGPHSVSARFPGHLESRKTIDVAGADEPQRFEVLLTKEPVIAPPIPERPFRTWKWVTGGGAAAALIAGIALIAIDGDGTCSGDNRECPERYDTAVPGILGVGLGLGLAGTSGWMFLRDRADSQPPAVGRKTMTFGPVTGGAVGRLSFWF